MIYIYRERETKVFFQWYSRIVSNREQNIQGTKSMPTGCGAFKLLIAGLPRPLLSSPSVGLRATQQAKQAQHEPSTDTGFPGRLPPGLSTGKRKSLQKPSVLNLESFTPPGKAFKHSPAGYTTDFVLSSSRLFHSLKPPSSSVLWSIDSDCSHTQVPGSQCFMKGCPCQERAYHLALSCQRTDCGITIRIQEFGAAGSKCRASKHMSPAWYFSFIWSRKVEISQRYSSNC